MLQSFITSNHIHIMEETPFVHTNFLSRWILLMFSSNKMSFWTMHVLFSKMAEIRHILKEIIKLVLNHQYGTNSHYRKTMANVRRNFMVSFIIMYNIYMMIITKCIYIYDTSILCAFVSLKMIGLVAPYL